MRTTGGGNPIDLLVGSRIRMFRKGRSMGQAQLGEKLGVTFQQVQKYENGKNRVSASRLQMISTALDVPVGQFFTDGAGTSSNVGKTTGIRSTGATACRGIYPAQRQGVAQFNS